MILNPHHVNFDFPSKNHNKSSYGGKQKPLIGRQHDRTRPNLPNQSRVLPTYSRNSNPPKQEREDSEEEAEEAAPLPLLIETARSILLPAILWPEIDTLIQLLAQMELYRIQVVEQVEELSRARRSFRPRESTSGKRRATMGESEIALMELLSAEQQNALRLKFHAVVFAMEQSVS